MTSSTLPVDPVLLRSGALGDFLLTLPLVAALQRHCPEWTLLCPRSRLCLLPPQLTPPRRLDSDGPDLAALLSPDTATPTAFAGRLVLSFLPDHDGLLARRLAAVGARLRLLDSRPDAPPHVSLRALATCGLSAAPEALAVAHLAHWRRPPDPLLWLHPGSGSPRKNAPLDFFRAEAEAWLAQHPGGHIQFSFGEADAALVGPYRQAFADLPAALCRPADLTALRDGLAGAAAFVGNDSGPGHLAAALGLPTTIAYTCTDPAVWRPVGPRVRIVDLRPAR